MKKIEINHLDHVAIIVKDMEVSALWYEEVLGLKKYRLPKWGPFPIFMMFNKCGVALFPAKAEGEIFKTNSKKIKIDHFAFNVDKENFNLAKERYDALGLRYSIQDHHYFHSIYTKDPDGHTVELTTLVVDANDFYN